MQDYDRAARSGAVTFIKCALSFSGADFRRKSSGDRCGEVAAVLWASALTVGLFRARTARLARGNGAGQSIQGLWGGRELPARLCAARPWLQQAVLAALALYTVWILVAVWRCAARAPPGWRFLARLSTIVWAGNALMVLGFLELDLIARLLTANGMAPAP